MSENQSNLQSKLYQEAEKHGFSKEQVDQLKNLASRLASKILKKFLIDFVEYKAQKMGLHELDRKEAKKQAKKEGAEIFHIYSAYQKLKVKLAKVRADDFSGFQEMSFEDPNTSKKHTLRYQLSIVKPDYEIELKCPTDISKLLLHYLDKFVDIALQYYAEITRQDSIIVDLANFLPNDDVSKLQLNVNNRTMYLDPEYEKRIGVLCFYVDENGKPVEY